MEYTEHLLKLARSAEAKAEELRGIVGQIIDVPVAPATDHPRRTVYGEMITAGFRADGGTQAISRRIVEQRQALLRTIALLQSEAEILTGTVSEVIKQNRWSV